MSFFFRRRECLLPTWRGWLALVVFAVLVGYGFVRNVYPWLAIEEPVEGGVLVAEGWLPDDALALVVEESRRHPYWGICVTGIPIEQGTLLAEYGNYANLSAATLLRMGADAAAVHPVPTAETIKDRTYAMACTLRDWLRAQHVSADRVNVVSLGPHARRTRLLYEKAFGPGTRVGIVAAPTKDFVPERWWGSSAGFRIVSGEIIAYLYARLVFRPEAVP